MNMKTNKIIYWVLTGLVAFILTASALIKLSGGEQAAEMAKGLGGMQHVTILGVLELVIVALWCFKRTGVVATLLAVAYLGGAIAVHFVNSQPVWTPAIIQVIVWLAAAYRFPELTTRLFHKQA